MKTLQAFQVADLPKGGLVGRLFGRVPREAVFVQIRNLLATTPFGEVRESDVADILASGKMLPREVTSELLGIFEQAVHILSADHELTPDDRRALEAIQRAFELQDSEATGAIEKAVGAIYERALREALADGEFTPSERTQLEQMAEALGLKPALQTQLYEKAAGEAVQVAYQLAVADGRLSGGEDARILALTSALGIPVTLEGDAARIVNRARILAQIDEGHLPSLTVPLLLGRGEACHFTAPTIRHSEMRVVTKRINYSGPTASIRIAKGLRWRAGSVSVQRVTQDVLTNIDTGNLYITSKKVFFQGARKNTSIPLSKIVSFKVYNDAIEIDKETGKDMYCIGEADWEIAGSCLDAAIRAAR